MARPETATGPQGHASPATCHGPAGRRTVASMDDKRRGAPEAPPTPDSRGEVDPDVAVLLGMRPTDADPLPDSDELDDMGEMTDTRIYEGELEARPPDSDQPDRPVAESLEETTDDAARA